MRLWHFSSSVNSFFKCACAAIQWGCMSDVWSFRLLPYFMCVNSEGYGETAWMCRLASAFAGRLCDKYHNLMSWLILQQIFTSAGQFDIFLLQAWQSQQKGPNVNLLADISSTANQVGRLKAEDPVCLDPVLSWMCRLASAFAGHLCDNLISTKISCAGSFYSKFYVSRSV